MAWIFLVLAVVLWLIDFFGGALEDGDANVSEWHKHDGRGRPIDGDALVVVRLANGSESRMPERARLWNWHLPGLHDQIVAYKIVGQA